MNMGIRRPIVYESAAAAAPEFFFRRGEPMLSLPGVTSTFGFDFFRRGEPAVSLTEAA